MSVSGDDAIQWSCAEARLGWRTTTIPTAAEKRKVRQRLAGCVKCADYWCRQDSFNTNTAVCLLHRTSCNHTWHTLCVVVPEYMSLLLQRTSWWPATSAALCFTRAAYQLKLNRTNGGFAAVCASSLAFNDCLAACSFQVLQYEPCFIFAMQFLMQYYVFFCA